MMALKTTVTVRLALWLALAMTGHAVCAETLVLAAANTMPTAFMEDGKPTGMLVDLVTEAFRRAGHSVEIRLMPWARCLETAKTGEVDGVFSSFKLVEREQFLVFSHEVLTTQTIAFFAIKDSTIRFDGNLNSVRDAKIGVINGTSYGEKLDAAIKDGVVRRVEQTNSIDSNLRKLVIGRVDLVPSNREVAFGAAKRLGLLRKISEVSPPLESVPSYLAFTKVRDMGKLSYAFDAALVRMKRDGTYSQIEKKYMAFEPSASAMQK